MTIFRCSLLIILVLSGCSVEKSADPQICGTVQDVVEAKPPIYRASAEERAERCVRRNSYVLAKSSDRVSDVADAAIEACRDEIVDVGVAIALGAEIAVGGGSQMTNEGLDMAKDWSDAKREELTRLAKLWVFQGRAGNCYLLLNEAK